MKYVISSAEFRSKKKALEQIIEWEADGTLDPNAKVYLIKKTFEPVTIVEIKLEKK